MEHEGLPVLPLFRKNTCEHYDGPDDSIMEWGVWRDNLHEDQGGEG